MSCNSCTSSGPLGTFNAQLFFSNDCFSCNSDCGANVQNSKCIIYTGPNLSCSGILTNDSIETALQKIDVQICSAIGDYSNYHFNCLPTFWGSAITQESEFVDAITSYACNIDSRLITFVDTTFPAYQSTVNGRFVSLEDPEIICALASVTDVDPLQTVLNKYCTLFGTMHTAMDISAVDWDQCLTVVSPPTTISGAFSLLVDQICQVYANTSGPMPTFNNVGSCLASPGTTDSLVSTIGKIRTYLCNLPVFDTTGITSTCITVPAPGNNTNLETLIQNMLVALDSLRQSQTTFSGDFNVTQTGGNPCSGVTVALATPLNQDRLVAATALDVSPGTLISKLSSPSNTVSLTNVGNTTVGVDISNGSKGDITVAGNAWSINANAVTFPKIQNIGTSTILGRSTAGTGNIEQLTLSGNFLLSGGILSTIGRELLDIALFTSNGTWVTPDGCNLIVVYTVGAGGGGGGVSGSGSNAAAGGGGGGGAFGINLITSGFSPSQTVTIGGGGNGGVAGNNDGNNGGTTSFGALISVTGGRGGKGMAAGTALATVLGGSTGVLSVTSGTILGQGGGPGDAGFRLSGTAALSGGSGSSLYNGSQQSSNVSGIGSTGNALGSGGSGALSLDGNNYAGGNGSSGLVIVYSYS